MGNAVTGVLHGTTITLDDPLPPLDGHRVRVVVELMSDEQGLSAVDNAKLLREWAARGPQGPLDEGEDFPDDL